LGDLIELVRDAVISPVDSRVTRDGLRGSSKLSGRQH
jgi:hypothetical protein